MVARASIPCGPSHTCLVIKRLCVDGPPKGEGRVGLRRLSGLMSMGGRWLEQGPRGEPIDVNKGRQDEPVSGCLDEWRIVGRG
jgi:hypothetical protein